MHRVRKAAAAVLVASLVSTVVPGGIASADPAGAVVDRFTRADSSSLGVAETGQSWSMWAGKAGVVSQQAEMPASGYNLAVVDSGISAGTAAITAAVASPEYWLVFRAADKANYWRFGRWQSGAYQLQQVVSNNLGSPGLVPLATVTPAHGDRLSCSFGAAVTCSVNGTEVVRTSDPFNSSARYVGLAGGGSTPTRFDDLVVQAPPQGPNLGVAVTAGSASADTGSAVSWTATVTNAGTGPATATIATVSVPGGLTNITLTASAGTCAVATAGWTCDLGNRPAGSVATIAVNGTAPSVPTTLTLTVGAVAQETDADPADDTASATVTTTTPPPPGAIVADGFSRVDSATLGQAQTGQPWVLWSGSAGVVAQQAQVPGTGYTLAVVDSGVTTGIASVQVPGISPEFWLVVRASDAGNYWRFGRWHGGGYQLQQVVANSLGSPVLTALSTVTPAAGDVVSCSFDSAMTCSVNGEGVVRTTDPFNSSARFVGFAAGGSPTQFDAVLLSPVPPSPDLRVEVDAAASTVDAGGQASWVATVTNHGGVTARATTLTITRPEGLSAATVSTSAGSCAAGAGAWTCAVGDQAPSGAATITVAGTAPDEPATLTVTVDAASQEEDPNPGDNSASATVTVEVPIPPDVVAIDGFGRPDSPSLGQAESGQPWVPWAGSARVAGGQAAAGDGGYTAAVIDSGTASGAASVVVPATSSEYWLIVRGTDSANYWRFGRWQGGGYQLQQVVGNALGSPAVTVVGDVVPSAADRLSCHLGSGLTCSVNDTPVVRTADAFNSTGRLVGLAAMGATRFDDVLVKTPQPGPDLRVTATPAADTVAPGAAVSWTATVTNDGTASATSTVVTVTPPSGLTGTKITSPAGLCLAGTATWTCDVGTRAVGTSLTVSVTGDAPTTGTTLTLTVSAAAREGDIDPSTDTATSTMVVRPPPPPGTVLMDGFGRADSASLGQAETGQAWATLSGTARVVGQQAEATGAGYTLVVADSGVTAGTASITVPTITNEFWLIVRATDSANYWRFGRWQGGPYQLQQVVANNLGSPVLSASATVTPGPGDRLSCKLGSNVVCSVNATVVVSTTDPFNTTGRLAGFAAGTGAAARFDDPVVTTPPPGPDLRVGVSATSGSATTGGPIAWSVTIANDGTATATAATATVTPPAGVTGVTMSSPAGTCSPTGGTWTCPLGSRAVGSVATISVNATAPAEPGTVSLLASATAAETDTEASNNTASASVTVRAPAAPGEVVVDDFNRPDAATLGDADTGQPWSTWTGGFGISKGAAAPTGGAVGMATLDPGWTYGTYEVRVTAGAAANAFSVVIRGRDAGNHFRVGPDSSGHYRIWKVVGGSVQSLQFNTVRADVPARDGDVIRVVNRPDDGIFVSVNGLHVLDAGDQALLSESRFGLAAASVAVRFDAVWISQVMSSGVTTADTFTDPDGTPLDGSLSESGTHYPWRASPGWQTHAGHLLVQGYGFTWVDTASEVAKAARVEVRSGTAEAALVFRYAENGSFYRFGHEAGGDYVVERVVGGQSTVVVRSTVAPQAVDNLEVRQGPDGRIECLVNGVPVASFVDATFNRRETGYGLEGNGAAFDAFSITPW